MSDKDELKNWCIEERKKLWKELEKYDGGRVWDLINHITQDGTYEITVLTLSLTIGCLKKADKMAIEKARKARRKKVAA